MSIIDSKTSYVRAYITKNPCKEIEEYPKPNVEISMKERIEQKIKLYRDGIEALKNVLEDLEKLPFKLGDAVFHKETGNCIVKSIYVGNLMSHSIDEHMDGKLIADVVCLQGVRTLLASELLPISSATKVLFNEGNRT